MKLITSFLAAAFAATTAQAQAFSDNFNAENGGNSALNYAGFANWTTEGKVDLVKSGDFGITCAGGSGTCVDLDGSTGPGRIKLNQTFTLGVGDVLRFSFDVSGSQRSRAVDNIRLGFFGTPFTNAWTAFFGTNFAGTSPLGDGSFVSVPIAGDAPWSTYFFEMTALEAGTIGFGLSTNSADNIGPLVDNVRIDYSASVVPEPSTYALMATGLTLLGGLARRKRRTA